MDRCQWTVASAEVQCHGRGDGHLFPLHFLDRCHPTAMTLTFRSVGTPRSRSECAHDGRKYGQGFRTRTRPSASGQCRSRTKTLTSVPLVGACSDLSAIAKYVAGATANNIAKLFRPWGHPMCPAKKLLIRWSIASLMSTGSESEILGRSDGHRFTLTRDSSTRPNVHR